MKSLKKMNKTNLKQILKNKISLRRKQKGGQAPSCISKPDVSKYMSSCHTANIHNTNPEAAFSIIEGKENMHMKGGACNSIPTQGKPMTFSDYLLRTSKEIAGDSGMSSNFNNTLLELEAAKTDGYPQSGGSGFSINPEEMIGGLPGRTKYDSCCQPAVIGGKLLQGKDTQSLCGNQMGGKRKSKKTKKTKLKSKHKKHSQTKKRISKRKRVCKGKKQSGGNPAKYPFKGENSNFDYLAEGKDFAGKQPYWGVDTR